MLEHLGLKAGHYSLLYCTAMAHATTWGETISNPSTNALILQKILISHNLRTSTRTMLVHDQ